MHKVAKKIDVKTHPFSKKIHNVKYLFKSEISSKLKQKELAGRSVVSRIYA